MGVFRSAPLCSGLGVDTRRRQSQADLVRCGENQLSVSRRALKNQSFLKMCSKFVRRWLVVVVALLSALASTASRAGLGDPLVAAGGDIVIRFEGTDADYDSLIGVNNVEVNGLSLFFPNHTTTNGSTINLGSFSAGLSLDIALHVVAPPPASNIWHTGAAALNIDNVIHANVIFDYNGEVGRTFVGFEDQFGGGDLDYDDHRFSFIGVSAVPEPGSPALIAVGLGTLAFIARRRRVHQG